MRYSFELYALFAVATAAVLVSCQELPFEPQVLSYDGNEVAHTYLFDGHSLNADGAGKWSVDVDKERVSDEADDFNVTFTVQEGEMLSGGAAVQFEFDGWSTDNKVQFHLDAPSPFRTVKFS